jgi:hypothetical protein
VAPTVIWLVVGESLSETAQLIANPLLVGVVLAVVLERLVPRAATPTPAEAAG